MDVTFYEDMCYFTPNNISLQGENKFFDEMFVGGALKKNQDAEEESTAKIPESTRGIDMSIKMWDV